MICKLFTKSYKHFVCINSYNKNFISFRDKIFPLMMKSGLQMTVNESQAAENFDLFVNEAWNNEEWKKELVVHLQISIAYC